MMVSLLDSIGSLTVFGIPLLYLPGLEEMLARFFLNIFVVGIIVHYFYFPKSQRRDYYFTFLLLSVSIFMLIYLMDGAKMKVGAALGLFAVFGIIRYRTESVPIREMTYLFFLVALSVVNAMSVKLSLMELLTANLLFLASVWISESNRLVRHVSCKYIRYDNINLITPDKESELKADLKRRTGLDVLRVEIGSIDFLRDCALIKMYYMDQTKSINQADSVTRLPQRYEE